jgi:hypothetical protein
MDIYELDSYRLSDAVKFHTELNPALWDGKTMRPEVRDALLKIADDFKTFMGIDDLAIEDITVSGSNAAFSYTPHSDIDLHLLVDFSRLNPDDVYQELFNAKKYQYNDQHNIKIRGYDVELYVQDSNKPVRSLGEYSIINNDWNRIPVQRRGNLDEKSTQQKYEKLKKLIELALSTNDLERVTYITDTLKKYRQAGLDRHGEFGPENLAYKILRKQGLIQKIFDHKAALEDTKLSLDERRKKKKKKKTFKYGAFGGAFFPGYGYYGQSGEASDGGGDGGGGESVKESTVNVEKKAIPLDKVVRRFVHFAARYLKLKQLPKIKLRKGELSHDIHSMGHYVDDHRTVEVETKDRHVMDILRTLAHELTHYRQHERLGKAMPDTAGRTGSPYENEANAEAGIIMRHFQNRYPEFFASTVSEDGDSVRAQYGDQTPPGPESPPTMPAGTLRVDVSDVYDWYKLGQHISNMKGLGRHDFGAGPPSSIISFGDEETEHKFIKDLEATGLDVTDIDPKDPKQPAGMRKIKTDPRYNVDENDLAEFAPGGGSISPPIKPPKNDGDRWEDEDDDDSWHPRKRTEADLHNPLGDQIRTLLKKKAKIVWYPWADREQNTQYRTQAVLRQVVSQEIIDGRNLVRFKYSWRPWYKTAKGMELGGWRSDQTFLAPNSHQYLGLVPMGANTYELQDLTKNPDWKDPRTPEEIEWQRRLDDLDEGLGKALGTAAVAGAMALGSPAAKAQSPAYDLGRVIYNAPKTFTKAGAEEELKGIARDLARGNQEIRVGGKRIWGGPQAQGERVAANGIGRSREDAYQAALNAAYADANRRYGPIAVGDWRPVEHEADDLGGQFRAVVVIQGPAPVRENASGYIPTKKQARDPRFKTALTVDIKPGQLGKEANKLGLQTDSQGRPDLLMKNLANALKEYKETGVFETVKPVTPPLKATAGRTQYPPMVKQKTSMPQDKPRDRVDGTGRIIDYEIREDEDLLEVKMSPSALESWAASPEAQGIRAGFEAEMIFRDTQSDEDEQDMEPDYDYDERPDSIEHVLDFFSNDDWGYGISGRYARELRTVLADEFQEWMSDKISEQWDSEAEDQVRDHMENNIWGDDSEREDRIRAKVEDMFPDDADAIMAAGDAAPRFTRSSDQETYVNENDLYAKYKEASDSAYEDFEAEIQEELSNQGTNYDNAREYYVEMMMDSGDYDESDFLRDQYGYMSDVANSNNLDWPYWTGGGSGGGSRSWDSIGDSLNNAVNMPVKVSSGYHSATRTDNRWIIEPDGSLEPDDGDDMGLEIVSPPMPLPQALEKLKAVIEWGNNEADAYTNSSTGLHMGVSIPYVGGNVDYVKLVLFMGDEYVLDKFGRASNTYAASAMKKLRQNMAGARNRGELTEAKLDPMGALELVQKNLIELAARYVQDGVGTSKYTSAHIKDGYIEFRSPGGDYLSMDSRGEGDDIRNTMLRFARAMQIAGSPSLERQAYAKKLYKLISPGLQDDGLKLFSEYAAGTITPEQLKKQWADAVLKKEIPTTGKEEYEVYDMENKNDPLGVIDTLYATSYDDAYRQYEKKYKNNPRYFLLDIRTKQPWFDVYDAQGKMLFTMRARDIDQAQEKAQNDIGEEWTDDWKVYRRPDNSPEPQKILSPRAQVAKRIKEPKVTPAVAADNAQDRKDIQARIGEPQPAGAVADTGYYRVTWTERQGQGDFATDSLNVDAPNATAAMDRVRSALQAQGREAIQIEANPQEPPAWRQPSQATATSTQGEFTGSWQVRDSDTNEVLYTFSGVGNSQADANRVAAQWMRSQSANLGPLEVVPVMR